MTVTTSYPGVYIEELPNLTHSIVPSPTSIAVFVGYTHPFLTPAANYKTAIPVASAADYRRSFGGPFSSPVAARLRRASDRRVLRERWLDVLRGRSPGGPVLQRWRARRIGR